jgi:hypothetical protein
MPLIRRLFLGGNGALLVAAISPALKLVPRRNPQFRQKRNSDGIAEWQFEQVIIGPDEFGSSELCDIANSYLFKAKARIYDEVLYAK